MWRNFAPLWPLVGVLSQREKEGTHAQHTNTPLSTTEGRPVHYSFVVMATPPPVHSSSVLIEPAVVAPTLEWYQFYEKRVVGRALGLGLIGASSAALLAVFKPWTWFSGPSTNRKALKKSSSYTVLPAALSVIALVVGIRLRTRKYFKDPVALKEYLELYHNSSFSIAFKDLGGWEGLNRGK